MESIRDYIKHLTVNGQLIIIAHNNAEIFKLAFTGLKALEQEGVSSAEGLNYMYLAGFSSNSLIVIKKSIFTYDEANNIHDTLMDGNISFPSSTYIPFISQHNQVTETKLGISVELLMLNQLFIDIALGKYSPNDVIKVIDYNLRPPVDDSPFFYNMSKNAPKAIMLMIILSGVILIIIFYSGNKGLSRWDKKIKFIL